MNEQHYREALENVASYNSRLCSERRQRLPFLDSQTGVAQNHTNLWIPYRYRSPGRCHGQIYSYPAQRWKKKCSLPLPDIPLPRIKSSDVEAVDQDVAHGVMTAADNSQDSESKDIELKEADQPAAVCVTGNTAAAAAAAASCAAAGYREDLMYTNDWENSSEPLDAGEIDQRNSDSSDYEEIYIRKKAKRKESKKSRAVPGTSSISSGTGRSRKKERDAELAAERDKPYSCELCGARYKTRPGLSYHLQHSHNKQPAPEDEMDPVLDNDSSTSVAVKSSSALVVSKPPGSGSGSGKYCDFCLGNESENKKTGTREEMVSCADCGRCGHPSCLQFTSNMIISVKKYPWQCIECKSCGICGTSDNDDQLLFCDDCDRGYHMYCLSPPLSEPPEGSWSCHLCIKEFYGGHKSTQDNTHCTPVDTDNDPAVD